MTRNSQKNGIGLLKLFLRHCRDSVNTFQNHWRKKLSPAKMYVKNIMPLQNKQVANVVMLDDDDLSNGKKR